MRSGGSLAGQGRLPAGARAATGLERPALGPIRIRNRGMLGSARGCAQGDGPSTSCFREPCGLSTGRRTVNLAALSTFLSLWTQEEAAEVSELQLSVKQEWGRLGDKSADLVFPREFLGPWKTVSTLVNVETPVGATLAPNLKVVERSRKELNRPILHMANFVGNSCGEVIMDRRHNTAALMQVHHGTNIDFANLIDWNPDDPDLLRLSLPGGSGVVSRVMDRSQKWREGDRLDTSESFEQVFDDHSGGTGPKVTASRCCTKYKWRSEEAARADGGPVIVAIQVVSEYLAGNGDDWLPMEARDQPAVEYTYRMALSRQLHG
eukprot:evm.model.scf_193.8 EVM.evm.TU.scf_193.8   scf_193:84578-88596(-)